MKKIWIIPALALVILVGIGCSKGVDNGSNNPAEVDRESILHEAKKNKLIMDDSESAQMADPSVLEADKQNINVRNPKSFLPFSTEKGKSGALADVTAGKSYGLANLKTDGSVFTVTASVGGLPETSGEYFYEGWIVKRGSSMDVLSTGKLTKSDEVNWINVYQTTKDISEFDFYVVTLEPLDDDPAPAEHILEGILR
jgi:hypothetical protein